MGDRQHWWEWRATVVALVIVSILPLVWPTIPPLIDLPGHMGRYAIQLGYDDVAVFREWYDIKWSLIGNLGIDLLIVPVSKLFGLELGVKLIVMTIPALTVAGLLWIAREVHGRVPPTALFALPLAYGHPFIFGFVNFALSMGFALCLFALWLRMARLGDARLRPWVFVPASILLWVCHTFGWGMLGVLAFSAELIRQHDRGIGWVRAWYNAGVHCLSLALPLLLMIAWRSGAVTGETGDWFNWPAKLTWLNMTLRDRWRWFDAASLGVVCFVIFFAIRDKRLGFSRNLAASALFLVAVFVLLPKIVFGSAYADMRLTPYMFAIAIVAIRPKPEASAGFLATLAALALVFFGVRTLGTTASFALTANRADAALDALPHVPMGARLVSFVGYPCGMAWMTNRMEHLPAIALVRRQAFSNDQWDMAGAQLLMTKRPEAGRYRGDPSTMVTHSGCPPHRQRSLDWSIDNLPRAAFDYVWLIDPPRHDPRRFAGMTMIWSNGRDSLWRIGHDRTAAGAVQ